VTDLVVGGLAIGQDELLGVEKQREKLQTWGCVACILLLLRNAL